jgi:hypothetical protein
MVAKANQIMPRYVPVRVHKTPEMTEDKEAPREKGIILKSTLSCADAAKASGIALT